ncbi:Ankyrin repeats (3 copies) family protein [Leishmania donovani]|uniref:Ankyrin repeats (3 copies) family protein n=1 Tax=Leishmania donovani TaxID=5661 RepID=A0A504Y344_LEIDO|nr:Ankyrin repeats (3 copies) family protein [Leishmania donovani]
MASTLPPEKKRKATKAAAGTASQRKGNAGGGGEHVREDPHHTWNQQLMEACLACDAAAVRKLIERGADPVNAREVPPLSYYTGPIIQQLQLQQQASSEARSHSEPLVIDQLRGDQPPRQQSPLPPLAAMLLSGLNTPAALEVMKVLIQHGASVNDTFSFSVAPLTAARPGTDVSENESGGSTAYGASANDSGGHRKNTCVSSPDPKGKQPSGKRKASVIGTALTAAAGGSALVSAAGTPGGAAVNPPEAPRHEESTIVGSTIVGFMRWQHQQRLGGTADAAGPNGLPSPTATPRVSQSRKSHIVSNAAATARTYGSAAAAQPATAVLPAQAAGPVSATSLVSPSAAEAVLTALQQVLRQRQTSTGGYHGLPILMSVYPQQQQKEDKAELGGGAATGSAAAPVVVAAAAPCNWWSLAGLCDAADAVVTDGLYQRTRLNFNLLDTCGRSAATLALERGDTLSVRLLSFYGAHVAFDGQVNASHTRLARACTHGDVARVEALLRQGDSITQISADGRYTLVHYAAAQPSVLRTLVEHGLSLEFENAFGESALTSLLRHGTARNDPRYVQTLLAIAAAVRSASTDGATNTATANLVNSIGSTISANAVRFAQLSTAVQRNMILCPPTPITTLMNAGGAASGSPAAHLRLISNNVSHGTVAQGTASKSNGGNASRPSARQSFLGGCEVGTWWSFLPPTATTADVLDSLLRAGAVMQGFVPDEELDLPYVLFSERQTSISAWGGGARGFARRQKRGDVLPARLPMRLTPLHHAIFDYHPELIRRLLVDYRVDPMHRDSQGATAVHYAALCTHAQSVLELLLSPQVLAPNAIGNSKGRLSSNPGPDVITGAASAVAGASSAAAGPSDVRIDLNAIDMAGRTPLFYAAYVGNATAVQRLIRFGGATLLCGKADKDGYTPLHVAVQQRHADIVELLIRHSNQLMSSAAGVGRGQPVDVLAELLASTSSGGGSAGRSSRGGTRLGAHRRSSSVLAPGSGHHGQGGSHSAGEPSLAGLTGIANPELLVNVEAVESVTHMTALEMAIKAQQQPQQSTSSSASLSEAQELQKERLLRIVSVLLSEAQASPLRPSGLANGGALLHRAVADGNVEMAELLLSQYTDPNEVDDSSVHLQTPLHLAASSLADDDEITHQETTIPLAAAWEVAVVPGGATAAAAAVPQQDARTLSPWRAAAALSESDRGSSAADFDGPTDDQSLLANSSFGYHEALNRSVASVEQAGADQSLSRTGEELVPDSRAGGDAEEDVLQDEHQQFLKRLAQWQCADHLLEPEKCWMLTDAQGQTPLHVLCSRSSPALQRMPAVLKLLEDLQAVTRTNSAIAAVAAGVFDGTRDDDHVLSLCWHLSDAHGRTPLHAAAQSGFVEAMEYILKQAPKSALAVDMQGRTPLHACVLMAASPTAATAVPTHAQGDDEEEVVVVAAERATRLRRMLSLLRSAVAAADSSGAAGTAKPSLPLQLQGTPLRRAAGDVLPSLSMKTIKTMSNAIGSAAAPHSSAQRLVASLVQGSSITAQLQRWQQSRHWGCPALAMKGIGRTSAHMRTACGDGLAAAAVPASRDLQPSDGVLTSSGAASEWKTYVQLPDGQGRTALLLAAEVGNVGAARELLRTM